MLYSIKVILLKVRLFASLRYDFSFQASTHANSKSKDVLISTVGYKIPQTRCLYNFQYLWNHLIKAYFLSRKLLLYTQVTILWFTYLITFLYACTGTFSMEVIKMLYRLFIQPRPGNGVLRSLKCIKWDYVFCCLLYRKKCKHTGELLIEYQVNKPMNNLGFV